MKKIILSILLAVAGAVNAAALPAVPADTVADPYASDIPLTDKYEWFQEDASEKYGYKHNGHVVIPAKYDDASSFREGLAAVKINNKYGFIDKTGTVVIPAKYEAVWSFSEGLAAVYIAGKWGYIDKTGTVVIPAKYDDWSFFKNGKAKVKLNGREFYIDKNGEEVK